MRALQFTFDRAKAIEAIIYLSAKIANPDIYAITHLMYFADKKSLEQYGRFTCGEDYYAMQRGPVPIHIYDILKTGGVRGTIEVVDGVMAKPLREADLDALSESDIECLDQSISKYGKAPYLTRRYDDHDRAYEAAWARRGTKKSIRISIESIVALLEHSEELLKYLARK